MGREDTTVAEPGGRADPAADGAESTEGTTEPLIEVAKPEGRLPRSGSVVGDRYRVADKIGAGGFGTVYRAIELRGSREVALKVLKPELVSSPQGLGRFEREAALAQRLRHPNTVVLHDYGSDDGLHYIVYELLEGHSLSAEIRKAGPLPGDRVVHITAQVLRSLAEAHELGIVHRDIKPANVFLAEFPGERDVVKVLDFGIAKDLSKNESKKLTKTGYTPGTPRYMAPEQLLARQARPNSDIYAVGLLMAEMLDGKPVFRGGPLDCIELKMGRESVPLLERARSSPLLPVVQRATERDPDSRYATALEMLAHIETITSTRPSLPAPLATTLDDAEARAVSRGLDDDAAALLAARSPLETTVRQGPALSDRPPPRYSDPPPHGPSNPPLPLVSQPPGALIPTAPAPSHRKSPPPTTIALVAVFVAGALLLLLGGWCAAVTLTDDAETAGATSDVKRPRSSKTSRSPKGASPKPRSTVHELVPLGDQAVPSEPTSAPSPRIIFSPRRSPSPQESSTTDYGF